MKGIFVLGIFSLAFVILDIYCVIKIIDYFKLRKYGICCYAKIIRLDKEPTRTGYAYRPWFEYKTDTGEYFTARCESSTSIKSAFAIGEKIKIYYDKNNPKKYIIDKNSLYVQIFLLFVGTIMLMCAGGLFIDLLIRTINYK